MIIDNPRGMVINGRGQIIISDSYTHQLYMFNENGSFISSIGGCGERSGRLHNPKGITVIDNYVFVCDLFNQRVHVFSYDEQEFKPVYAINHFGESNIWPCHIACGANFEGTTYLYITGTNRIYVCQLSGGLNNPNVQFIYSILNYKKEENKHTFKRIGGIAVEENRINRKAILVVTETFHNTVLTLEMEFDGNEQNVPKLIKGVPYNEELINNENRESFYISTHEEFNEHSTDALIKKPHPVVIWGNYYITSTDEEREEFFAKCRVTC